MREPMRSVDVAIAADVIAGMSARVCTRCPVPSMRLPGPSRWSATKSVEKPLSSTLRARSTHWDREVALNAWMAKRNGRVIWVPFVPSGRTEPCAAV